MTERRLGYLLAASLVVLVFAIWVVQRQSGTSASHAGRAVLAGLDNALNSVTEVRITGPGGVHTSIDKGARRWMVGERGYPADSGKLRKLLIDLGDLKIVERKTRLAQNYPMLGVQKLTSPKASGVRIDMISPHKTWSLIVGHTANSNDCYVRVVGHKQSLLASPLVMADANPAQWLDPIIIDLSHKSIRAIEERPARGPAFDVSRAKATEANFTVHRIPPGRKLDGAGAADQMASALSNLTADHGNIEAIGEGRPREGSLVETRGERARVYDSDLFRNQVAAEFGNTLLWPGLGLPSEMKVLLAAGRSAFVNKGERVVAHGGISIEEVLVPFVRFWRE